jgi:hypothetical protein
MTVLSLRGISVKSGGIRQRVGSSGTLFLGLRSDPRPELTVGDFE